MTQRRRTLPRPTCRLSARATGLMLALAGLLAVGAPAQAAGKAWAQLTAQQQTVLRPLAGEWDGIEAARRQKWLEVAARFDRMAPAEQARVQERMREWARLSPSQRGQARLNYREAQRLLPGEARQADWAAYRQLSDEERKSLAQRPRTPPPDPGAAAPGGKLNTVPNPLHAARPKVVAPAVVRAAPGASTRPMNQAPTPPLHQQPGLPKIAATPDFVDPATLLPRRGAQGAAAVPPAREAAPAAERPRRGPPSSP